MNKNPVMKKTLAFGVGTLVLMSLIATVGHYLPKPDLARIAATGTPPGPKWFLEQIPLYAQHYIMTFLHVVPAFCIMVLMPLQLSKRIRQRHPALHRWSGRVFVFMAFLVALSAVMIGIVFPYGGMFETVTTLIFAASFLWFLFMGVYRARQKEFGLHREWMLRMLAVALAPATMRFFLIGIGSTTNFEPTELFVYSMIMGYILNLMIVEAWIDYGKLRPTTRPADTESDKKNIRTARLAPTTTTK